MIALSDTMNSSDPLRSYSARDRMTLLPEDFEPSEDDVICGRGKKCYGHIGNSKFRQRVIGMLDAYQKAKTKLDKSKVLSDVVEQVRLNSPRGGFVKEDAKGRWHEVGDFLAREKTSQAFRDALHENYKSSNVAKKKRRQLETPRTEKPRKMLYDADIERRMEKLTFGFGKAKRSSAELRQDLDRPRSFSAEPAPSYRLVSPGSRDGPVTELNISALGGVKNTFKPFYFRGQESRGDIRHPSRPYRSSRSSESYSVPSSPSNVPSLFDNRSLPDFHSSMPSMGYTHDPQLQPTMEMESMHLSAPELGYFDASEGDMDPLPYDLSVPELHTSRSTESCHERGESMTISSSLIESLARLTSTTEKDEDDNPFEPIPLSPVSKKPTIKGSDFLNIESDAFEE